MVSYVAVRARYGRTSWAVKICEVMGSRSGWYCNIIGLCSVAFLLLEFISLESRLAQFGPGSDKTGYDNLLDWQSRALCDTLDGLLILVFVIHGACLAFLHHVTFDELSQAFIITSALPERAVYLITILASVGVAVVTYVIRLVWEEDLVGFSRPLIAIALNRHTRTRPPQSSSGLLGTLGCSSN